MNILMRKDVKWQWGEEQQKVFDKLKRKIGRASCRERVFGRV